jgi:arylsulfatase
VISDASDIGSLAGEVLSEPDRTNLPIRRLPFQGVSNKTLDGSKPDWNLIGHPEAPPGAPNVLLVLIDDAGFGNPSTFGGPISTPRYTQMAEAGLRYNRFHVTALCSPTRAALLTGRNNHAVGFGSIGELSSGFPRLHGHGSPRLHALAEDPGGERVQYRGVR